MGNILARSPRLRQTTLLSSIWAVGHMATATAITLAFFTLKDFFLKPLLANLDWMVALMLLTIGALGILWEAGVIQRHTHPHAHGNTVHTHPHLHMGSWHDHGKMLGIGFIHGVASNDELLLLLTAILGVTTLAGMLLGVLVFSLGVVAGMVVFGLGLTYPILRWGHARVKRAVNLGVGTASILYGLLLLLGVETVNLLPLPILG